MEEIVEPQGIIIEIENYRIIRLDVTNIAIQQKKNRVSSGEVYFDTVGYYSTEEAAFKKLFSLSVKDTNKRSIAEAITTYRQCEQNILNAIKSR